VDYRDFGRFYQRTFHLLNDHRPQGTGGQVIVLILCLLFILLVNRPTFFVLVGLIAVWAGLRWLRALLTRR
jgi:hypothetical protein